MQQPPPNATATDAAADAAAAAASAAATAASRVACRPPFWWCTPSNCWSNHV
jgi:hypothetical protein